MRLLIVLIALFCVNGSFGELKANRLFQANVDKYIDVLLNQVDKYIIQKGMDPLKLDDVVKSFSVKPIIITYHGELALRHGHMQGLSQVKRGGNSEMSYEAMYLNIKLPILLERVAIDYDYSVKLMDIGPSGALDAKIKNLLIFVDVTIDTKTLEVILQDFHIIDTGTIEVKFAGHPIVDWLANAISKLVTVILHDVVQNVIEVQVKQTLEETIQEINNRRPPHGSKLLIHEERTDEYYRNYLSKSKLPELHSIKFLLPNSAHINPEFQFE